MQDARTSPPPAWTRGLGGSTEADRLRRHENTLLLVLTLLIGALVGLAVVAFMVVTERLGAWLLPAGGPAWRRVLVPTAGALVTGVLLARYFPNARGSGIPQTKTAYFLNRGVIRLRTVLGKFGCSSLSLASGIALGREGPTVQVGAGIASVLGRRLGLGPERVRALIPIGSSAALAAAFNTPIAAVLFTLEEILGDLHAPVIGSIVISSATSWAVLHLLLGDEPLFHVPAYQLVHPLEFGIYAVLGVAGGLVSVAFVKLLLGIRRRFLAMPRSSVWWQPAVGGLAVGLLGWLVPNVLGVGYDHVGDALNGRLVLGTMAVLLALKLVATAAAYGSGNAGGIFGPSLFIGAMLGGTVGGLAHAWLPDLTGSAGAYALVGMGTAFAGIVRAPMTSVIMIFEITRDYSIIVPVMIANLLSYFISQRLQPSPVYEALLHQDRIQLPAPRTHPGGMVVEQIMGPPDGVASADETVSARLAAARESDQSGCPRTAWPVVDGGRFLGMVTERRLREAALAGRGGDTLARVIDGPDESVSAEDFPHVHVDQPVDVALQRMGRAGLDVLPVVSRSNVRELLGLVTLSELPGAYTQVEEHESPHELRHETVPSGRGLLTAVVAGVLGLFLLGGLLAHHFSAQSIRNAEASYKAGNQLLSAGRVSEAIEQFHAALSLDHSDQYRLALGLALAQADRTGEARGYLETVLRAEPANGPAALAMARLSRDAGDVPAATAWYRRAVNGSWPKASRPERVDAAFEFVDFLEKAGDRRQAVAQLLQLAAQTTIADELDRIGRALLALASPGQAADVFRQVLRASPTDATASDGLGRAEMAQQDYGAARAAFEQAARLDPANEDARAQALLCARVLALDPRQEGLSVGARYDRSRTLLSAVVSAVEGCQAAADAGGAASPLVRARKALASSGRPRSPAEAAEDNIQLAENLWANRPPACPGAGRDEAVALAVARRPR